MVEKYKGYAIEYVDYRGDYRIYDPSVKAGVFNYADSIEEAKRAIDELEFKRTDDRRHDAVIAMNKYLSSHNYGKNDYPVYSQDPEWQRLNHELVEADEAHKAELKQHIDYLSPAPDADPEVDDEGPTI